MALHPLLFAFFNAWSLNPGTKHNLWYSENGEFRQNHGGEFGRVSDANVYVRDSSHMQNNARIDNLLATAQRVDNFYIGTTYRNVLTNATWRAMYQVGVTNVSYVDGVTPAAVAEQTIPCHECGIVQPLLHMTVDHQKPQVGGATQAVFKVLRAVGTGMTHQGATGAKASQIAALATNPLTAPAAVPTKRNKIAGMDYDKAWKYTLTTTGMAFISAVVAAGAMYELERSCMHSLVNLAPVCFRCNAIKNNGIIDLSSINS